MLQAQRYADDGDAEDDAEPHMHKGDFDATADNPDDVHQNRQATSVIRTCCHFTSEGPEGESCHLEQLHPERNADDGQTEKQADNGIIETDQNASKHQP